MHCRDTAKNQKEGRPQKMRKVGELQADTVRGPGFLDKEPAEDIIYEDETSDSQDEECLLGRARGSVLPKKAAEEERPSQQARPKRHRRDLSSDADSILDAAQDTVSKEDVESPQEGSMSEAGDRAAGSPRRQHRSSVGGSRLGPRGAGRNFPARQTAV